MYFHYHYLLSGNTYYYILHTNTTNISNQYNIPENFGSIFTDKTEKAEQLPNEFYPQRHVPRKIWLKQNPVLDLKNPVFNLF